LRERLADAHQRVAQALENQGFKLFAEPKAGLFLWAHHPDIQNAAELAYKAAEQDISLGPGHLFTPNLTPSPWLRFNVAYTDEPQVWAFLKQQTQPA
jgi:DNA-binding transcriptional MocR family regulator